MASNQEEIDSNNNSPSHSPSKPNNLLTVIPAAASVSTPNKLLSPSSLTPRKKIFPPLLAPISPKLIRERATSKASEKLMKSVTENRLLNEVIALQGELNDARLKLEECKTENFKLKDGNSEIQEKYDEINDVKAKLIKRHKEAIDMKTELEVYQAENLQLKKTTQELKDEVDELKKKEGEFHDMGTKLERYLAENSQLKKKTKESYDTFKKREGEYNDMRTKLEGYRTENIQLKKKTEELTGEVIILKKKSNEYQAEISELKKEIDEFKIRWAKKAPSVKEVLIPPTRASRLRRQASQTRKTNFDKP